MNTPFQGYADNPMIDNYKTVAIDLLKLSFPLLGNDEIECAVDWTITEHLEDANVQINNNYKNMTIDMKLTEVAKYILDRQPIITSYGVMFKRHGTVPNPIYTMVDGFIEERGVVKSKMFEYPKGTELFEKYNLLQLLLKIDANGYYGATGMYSCIYYNLYTACTTTAQGKSCNSAAALFFESFLNNNVPFASMNEIVTFIHNTISEQRLYDDTIILDNQITYDECFFKLIASTGFDWTPSKEENMIIWEMITQLPQEDINRLYYKNNLFAFVNNSYVTNTILAFLTKLDKPYMDPNRIPEGAEEEIKIIYDLIYEYVYYHYQVIDRLDKMNSLVRSVSVVQDTDSAIISLDGWYRFVLDKCLGVPMRIKQEVCDRTGLIDGEEDCMREALNTLTDYDFINDEIVEVDRLIDPMVIIPQDNLRYSIINLISYCITNMVNDFMSRYAVNSNSDSNGRCMLSLKNEFLYDRFMITDGKKHYAGKLKLQEGKVIEANADDDLDIKGLDAFVKTSMNKTTRKRLKQILYEDILTPENVDQLKVIKDLSIMEKDIFDSIQRGERTYFKPVKIKAQSSYDDPMRIQGIKAACAYNAIHEDGTEALDLTIRNAVDVVKTDINIKNVDSIKEQFPSVYAKAMELFKVPKFADGIDAIAIPLNEPVPDWVKPFIRYTEIINDNLSKFPLESIGLFRGASTNNTTNLIKF